MFLMWLLRSIVRNPIGVRWHLKCTLGAAVLNGADGIGPRGHQKTVVLVKEYQFQHRGCFLGTCVGSFILQSLDYSLRESSINLK